MFATVFLILGIIFVWVPINDVFLCFHLLLLGGYGYEEESGIFEGFVSFSY